MSTNKVPEGATVLVGIGVAEKMTGRHRVTIWRDYKRGEFPAPFYVGSQRRWRLADIEAWISAQASKSACEAQS